MEDKVRELIREAIFDVMTEGLCPKGKAYIAKRKSPYLLTKTDFYTPYLLGL